MKDRIFSIVVLMVVLPLLAESIYAPGLPDLASSFSVSDVMAEATLSIYLLGMSIGVLFWGNLSDVVGRKPVVIVGFLLFLFSTICCYLTADINIFMCFRFLQAFGGAVSSVCQSINRDVFEQKERMVLSSKIGTAVSLAPAVGALLGGVIAEYFGWRESFLFLMLVACVLIVYFYNSLPETKQDHYLSFCPNTFKQVAGRVLEDKNLIANASIIGLGLGVLYAFMSEGAFYCMGNLSFSTRGYSVLCASGSIAYGLGCRISNHMIQIGLSYQWVMKLGTGMMLICYTLLMFFLYFNGLGDVSSFLFSMWTIRLVFSLVWTLSCLGLSFILTPCFANALEEQRESAGVAASILAFMYNIISTVVNIMISYLHSSSLYRMPMIFLAIVLIIAMACDILYRNQARRINTEKVLNPQ